MNKNSQRRIRKRQEGALARRQEDIIEIEHKVGLYEKYDDDVLYGKLSIAKTDIENLAKKGIR